MADSSGWASRLTEFQSCHHQATRKSVAVSQWCRRRSAIKKLSVALTCREHYIENPIVAWSVQSSFKIFTFAPDYKMYKFCCLTGSDCQISMQNGIPLKSLPWGPRISKMIKHVNLLPSIRYTSPVAQWPEAPPFSSGSEPPETGTIHPKLWIDICELCLHK